LSGFTWYVTSKECTRFLASFSAYPFALCPVTISCFFCSRTFEGGRVVVALWGNSAVSKLFLPSPILYATSFGSLRLYNR
jgi:hypothetical protein